MKYTMLFKKVIREVIGLITIVLFIYTCTKIKSVAVHRKTGSYKTLSAIITPPQALLHVPVRLILTPAIRLSNE